MSEPLAALGADAFDGRVRVQPCAPQGMILIRADLGDAQRAATVSDVAGVRLPGRRGTAFAGARGLLWMSPDEALLLLPYPEVRATLAELDQRFSGAHALVADVSDARALFRLTGEGLALRETLAKLAPVDMAPGIFEPGEVRRTRLAQVAAAFWMRDAATIELVCFRSVAHYVFDLLCTAAAPDAAVTHF